MSRPRRVRRLTRWIVTNARALGVTIFILSIILTRLSKPFRDGLENFHQDFADNVESAFGNLRNMTAATLHLFYDRHDLIPIYMTEVFLEPSLRSIVQDALVALLDSSSAAWSMCTALCRLYLHFIRGIMRLSHTCFPHVSPIVSLCADEFAALPFRGQLLILSSIAVNALALVAWRRGWLARATSKLLAWHQSVALTIIAIGPYMLVLAMLYLPTKNALSFSTFRVAFQWTAFTVMLLQSLAACAQIWNANDKTGGGGPGGGGVSTHTNNTCASCTPCPPQSARLTPSEIPSRSRLHRQSPHHHQHAAANLSMTPRVITEQRQHISSLLSSTLNYWTLIVCWHVVTQIAYMILEVLLDTQVPVFNFWNIGRAYDVPTHHVVLTRQSILENSHALLDKTDLASIHMSHRTPGLATRILIRSAWLIITCDEVVSLLMMVVALIGDEKSAKLLRRNCTKTIESIIRRITGLDIQLIPSRHMVTSGSGGGTAGTPSSSSPSAVKDKISFFSSFLMATRSGGGGHSSTSRYTQKFADLFTYAGHRLTDLLRHFAPLTLLLLPVFILRWIFLIIALIIPAIYSLRALWTQQLALQAYWLCYFTGLVICLAIGDTLASSSSIAGYLISGIRAKLAVVSLLQFICVEPKTLGTWVARQATRVSVSAIATARRRVQTPSTMPPRSPTSTGLGSFVEYSRPRRESVQQQQQQQTVVPAIDFVPDEILEDVPRPSMSTESTMSKSVEKRLSESSHDNYPSFAQSLTTSVKGGDANSVKGRRKGSEATTTSELSGGRGELRRQAAQDTGETRAGGAVKKTRQRKEDASVLFKRASSQVVERTRRRPSTASLTLTGTKSK